MATDNSDTYYKKTFEEEFEVTIIALRNGTFFRSKFYQVAGLPWFVIFF